MSKNTRWAMALVGVVILIVAAVVIGTSGDSTTATETDDPATPIEQPTELTPTTAETGATGSDDSNTGGASPSDPGSGDSDGSGDDTGGASPESDDSDSGGAPAGTSRATAPLLKSGSVKTIKVDKGDTVYFRAKSTTADELHIHGYDKYVDLPAGKTVNYKFTAHLDGVYEIELHGNGEKVAVLKVSP